MLRFSLLAMLVGASACATRSSQVSTIPVAGHYDCGATSVDREGAMLRHGDGTSHLGWSDDAGDHFVSWPVSPAGFETVEYTVPRDAHHDAVQHVWDTSKGTSRTEWRLLASDVCRSRGTDTDVLSRFMNGESIDDVARDLAI